MKGKVRVVALNESEVYTYYHQYNNFVFVDTGYLLESIEHITESEHIFSMALSKFQKFIVL